MLSPGLIQIPCGPLILDGDFVPPSRAMGVVIFAHGSGSSRESPRNLFVAQALAEAGLGTLLFSFLNPMEDPETASRRPPIQYDLPVLVERLKTVTLWIGDRIAGWPLGYYGTGIGAAAAFLAAADLGTRVRAIVSRSGRPDLARGAISRVRAPTLLLVGSRDEAVIPLNEAAHERLRCKASLTVVPGATELFEEPGALETAAHLASNWFLEHLAPWESGRAP